MNSPAETAARAQRAQLAAAYYSGPAQEKPQAQLLAEVVRLGETTAAALLYVEHSAVISWFPRHRADGRLEPGWEPGFTANALAVLRNAPSPASH